MIIIIKKITVIIVIIGSKQSAPIAVFSFLTGHKNPISSILLSQYKGWKSLET